MKTLTLPEFHALLKAQDVPAIEHLAFKCPLCDTIQSAADLIDAGAGENFDEVEKYLGFSCVGRWTHGNPPPPKAKKGKQIGCDWTLGGLLRFHTLEVINEKGKPCPRFEPCTPEEAQQHHAAKSQ